MRIQKKQHLFLIFLDNFSNDMTISHTQSILPQISVAKLLREKDLKHAIEQATDQAHHAQAASCASFLEGYTLQLPDRLFLKVNERMVRLFFHDILWVEANDYYCTIVTKKRTFLACQTLKKFSEAYQNIPLLLRVHRSYLINLHHVEEIGDLCLYINNHQIPVSKIVKEELLRRFYKSS